MPVPLIPLAVGAAGAALLLAGHAEKAKAEGTGANGAQAPSTINATPTQQSTGGAQGGAQTGSHADFDRQTQLVQTAPPPADVTPESVVVAEADLSSGITVGAPEHVTDTWAPTSGASLDVSKIQASGGALGAIAEVGGLTGKALADSFTTAANSYGSLWGIW